MDGEKKTVFHVQGCIDEETNGPITACAFTGHRELASDFSTEKLMQAIDGCIARGAKIFYCGMAMGFDLLAAEYVLMRKRQGAEIGLFACVPYPDQARAFSDEDKGRYNRVLSEASGQYLACEEYRRWCMSKRNDYMVDHADVVIAYCHKDKGGTAYTVKRALKQKKSVIFV